MRIQADLESTVTASALEFGEAFVFHTPPQDDAEPQPPVYIKGRLLGDPHAIFATRLSDGMVLRLSQETPVHPINLKVVNA